MGSVKVEEKYRPLFDGLVGIGFMRDTLALDIATKLVDSSVATNLEELKAYVDEGNPNKELLRPESGAGQKLLQEYGFKRGSLDRLNKVFKYGTPVKGDGEDGEVDMSHRRQWRRAHRQGGGRRTKGRKTKGRKTKGRKTKGRKTKGRRTKGRRTKGRRT